uniref:OBP19 n=1 Tax=Corythucha ciliata TaxID=369451 RepID=A0A3G2YV88_CORCT|nr:OBP19 [Corythucha ciliata]
MASRLVNTFVIFLLLTSKSFVESMTKQQIKDSGKLLKKSCMPKNDVTEDQVGDISQGKFIEERNVMCYVSCVYTMGQVIKNNKIVYDAFLKQIDLMYPADLKDAAKSAVEKCREVGKKYKDICEAAYWTAKCLYDVDANSFMFP